jgi:carboxyl-terminal processing protease
MRGTSGGSLEQAWRVVDEFMSSGAVAVARRADGQERSYHASEGGGWSNHPIVTVVDGGTSGAAEAIAAALQANRRSCLIGAPTYGMGSLQREFVLSDGSLARITVEVWYTAQGEILHGRGVQPEILLQPERVSGGWALTVAEAYLRRLAER